MTPRIRQSARVAAGGLALALAGVLWQMRAPLFDGNLHAVIPGAVYRSAQLDPVDLEAQIEALGIRSVVDLRMLEAAPAGAGTPPAEVLRALERRDVAYHGLRMAAPLLPPRDTVRELVRILDAAERPVLIHCRNGTDRTGFASALAVLLDGAPVARARAQFALRHGYLAWLSRSDLPAWIDLYEAWLRAHGAEHSSARVREFVRTGYTPYFYDARIEPLSFPDRVEVGRAARLAFRVTNLSPRAWTFTTPSPAGVHLGLRVRGLDPASAFSRELRGETPDRVFGPGESIELSATLPALPEPGRYEVTVDLVDELVVWFADMGSKPFERIVEARLTPRPMR